MASTITNTTLDLEGIAIPVALKGITERKDKVKFVRVSGKGNEITTKVKYPETTLAKGAPLTEVIAAAAEDEPVGTVVEVDAVTGDEIEEDECKWGIYGPDGRFYEVPRAAIDEVEQMAKPESLRIERFVAVADVPWERAQASYFLAAQKDAPPFMRKPLAMLHEALRRTSAAAVVRLIPKSKEHLAVVYAKRGGLLVTTLAWASEFAQVEDAARAVEGVEVRDEMVGLVTKLIEALREPGEVLDAYEDSIRQRRERLAALALEGAPIEVGTAVERAVVRDGEALMDALRESVARAQQERAQREKPKDPPARKPRAASSVASGSKSSGRRKPSTSQAR